MIYQSTWLVTTFKKFITQFPDLRWFGCIKINLMTWIFAEIIFVKILTNLFKRLSDICTKQHLCEATFVQMTFARSGPVCVRERERLREREKEKREREERERERERRERERNILWLNLTFGQGSPSCYLSPSPSLVPFPLNSVNQKLALSLLAQTGWNHFAQMSFMQMSLNRLNIDDWWEGLAFAIKIFCSKNICVLK